MIINEENKMDIIEQLASQWCDAMDVRDLENYFINNQIDWLLTLDESEIKQYAIESGLIYEDEEE